MRAATIIFLNSICQLTIQALFMNTLLFKALLGRGRGGALGALAHQRPRAVQPPPSQVQEDPLAGHDGVRKQLDCLLPVLRGQDDFVQAKQHPGRSSRTSSTGASPSSSTRGSIGASTPPARSALKQARSWRSMRSAAIERSSFKSSVKLHRVKLLLLGQ